MDFGDALAAYRRAPDELDAAIAGLSDAGLDMAHAPGEWSTRQIVHHLADGEAHWLTSIKMALLESGSSYRHNDWNNDASSDALGYRTRAVHESLALFRAQRAHVGQLLGELPAAWERSVQFNWTESGDQARPRTVAVSDIINMQIRHAAAHIAEINENRRAGGQ